jgi:hypothetical protein
MSTIKQKTAVVEIEGGPRFELHRMRWKPTKEFLRKLAAVVTQLIREGRLGQLSAADGTGKLSFLDALAAQIPAIIEQSEELVTLLVTQSTDLTPEKFDELDALAASELLSAALEVNCDQELKNSWAGIVAKVAALLPAPTVAAEAPKTS